MRGKALKWEAIKPLDMLERSSCMPSKLGQARPASSALSLKIYRVLLGFEKESLLWIMGNPSEWESGAPLPKPVHKNANRKDLWNRLRHTAKIIISTLTQSMLPTQTQPTCVLIFPEQERSRSSFQQACLWQHFLADNKSEILKDHVWLGRKKTHTLTSANNFWTYRLSRKMSSLFSYFHKVL